ncbi:response regulator [Neobacillus mesonae]|uniref:DNA-binding response regulator n=1 Tax=Neobacillus mesonae TaxID=1193713 RepID=A0A3Q9R1N2_9BACI|nr:response regulator transcription factor [Neobacillus mesonae]AZU64473.1 DNA-binding response regulator [Neobacillus mesonae]
MIRIVIAEDQELLLGTIGSLLNLEEDMEVVGLAKNGEEALSLVHRLKPDVCIMDIEMPEMNGLEAAAELVSTGCKVIILTTFARTGYFRRALQANVKGYLLKDNPSEELTRSIRCIMKGKRIYASELIDDEGELVDSLADDQIINTHNQQRKTIGTVKNYFATILDKMKLPTG